jgi:hypothetical protein
MGKVLEFGILTLGVAASFPVLQKILGNEEIIMGILK